MTSRPLTFYGREGSNVTLTRNVTGSTETCHLDYVMTRRRLSDRKRTLDAVCETRRLANRVATICRIINPAYEYWVEEYPGWGWIVKERDITFSVGTVTHITTLGDRDNPGSFLTASELSRLTQSDDAAFTY